MIRQLKMYYTPIVYNIYLSPIYFLPCHYLQYLNKKTWASPYMQRKVWPLLKFSEFLGMLLFTSSSEILLLATSHLWALEAATLPHLLMLFLICITSLPSHKNLNTRDNQRELLHCLNFFLVIPISGMIVCISPVPSLIPDSSLPLALSTPRIFNPPSSTSQYSLQNSAG